MENTTKEQTVDLSGLTPQYGGLIEELKNAGAHFGYSRTRRHPSVKPFLYASKNKMDVINLEETAKALQSAMDFVQGLAKEGKQILFTGNKKEARDIVAEGAKKIKMPYVSQRWIGGTLTNTGEIRKRIARLEDLLQKKATGGLDVYTKKERLLIDREIARLQRNFSGIVEMRRLPAALIAVDSGAEKTAITEAQMIGIPVITLSGTDSDISGISYPVVANDSSISSIAYFIDKIVGAYKNAPKTANFLDEAKKVA